MSNNPVCFSHVGLSVANIEEAIAFYQEVFGWYHIAGPFQITRDGRGGDFSNLLYGRGGKQWGSFRLAHMSTADRIGVELLEFAHGFDPDDDFDYQRHGVFHFGLQTPDVDGLIEEVIAHGGERITPTNTIPVTDIMGLTQTHQSAFAKDPFGNIFEVYSYSYEVQSKLPTKLG